MVLKQHPSSFTGTDLGEHLESLGKKKIVLAGEFIFPVATLFLFLPLDPAKQGLICIGYMVRIPYPFRHNLSF